MTPQPGDVIHDVPHHDHPGPCTLGHACMDRVKVLNVERRGARLAVDWQDPDNPAVTGVTTWDGAA